MPTIKDLQYMQAMPLDVKIGLTKARIREWVNYYGIDGVAVSFSGGIDSTVLLALARQVDDRIKAVFIDVPTQFPELKQFVQTFDNVDIIKPKIGFVQVCEKYGFPMISKEVSESVSGARKYLKALTKELNEKDDSDRQTDACHINIGMTEYTEQESMRNPSRGATITSLENSEELASMLNDRMKNRKGGSNQRLAIMMGWLTRDKENPIMANIPDKDRSKFAMTKYKFFLEAPFEISNHCCTALKKAPAHAYTKQTGRYFMTGEMATESRLRTQKWLQNGCNGFNLKIPKSTPMAFWTTQDVLTYIKVNNLPICSLYGEIVIDYRD